jgi:hypothetical protein
VRHLHLSRLPAWLSAQGVNPLCPGVHPALQLAYSPFGTGAHPPLWNPRQQSQEARYPSSPRDLRARRTRRGVSGANHCGQIDVLSVVRKSRNSSGSLYRCRRCSAHDRRRTNAIRFLMNTLLALISAARFMRSDKLFFGCARAILLCSSCLDPWLRAIRAYWPSQLRHPDFWHEFKLGPPRCYYGNYTPSDPSFAPFPSPSLTVLFPRGEATSGVGFVQPSSKSPRSPKSEITLSAAETYSTQGCSHPMWSRNDGCFRVGSFTFSGRYS